MLSRNSTWTFTRDVDLKFTFAGVNYYDGQGFMVPKDLGVDLGQGARRRHRLHPDRHHHRAQPRRLVQGQRHQLPAGADPDQRRGRPAVPRRRLRRLHHRRLGPRRQPRHLREPGRLHHPARDHLQGAARAAGAPGRRPVGRHRALDAERAGRRRGVRRHLGERRGDGGLARTPRSTGCSASRATSARCSASTPTGPSARSWPAATTARSSPRTSARARPSNIARGLNAPVDRRRPAVLAAVPLSGRIDGRAGPGAPASHRGASPAGARRPGPSSSRGLAR